jgi:iron complex outermembrane receptor protein
VPLSGDQVEVGFKYQPRGMPFMVNAALYELHEKNRLVQPDILFDALQGANVKTRGFEIEAVGRITENLKVMAAYSYTEATYDQYPIYSYEKGTDVEGVPRHMASLWGIYTFNQGWLKNLSLGGGVRYIGSSDDVGERWVGPAYTTKELFTVTTPSYTLFDAMVAYETKDWRWQLTAQNLEDKYYVVSCTAYRGDCGIGQGRTIISSFTYKF